MTDLEKRITKESELLMVKYINNSDNPVNIYDDRLEELVNLDRNNIIYDNINGLFYIRHKEFGLIPFKVIGYNVDGEDCITLMADKIVTNMPWYRGGTNWQDSYIRNWLNNHFYNGLPTSIKNIIEPVSKKTNKWKTGIISTSTEIIWLLSKEEADGKSNYNKEIVEGYDSFWWLRSPFIYDEARAYYVKTSMDDDNKIDYCGMVYSMGVVPCFVIK